MLLLNCCYGHGADSYVHATRCTMAIRHSIKFIDNLSNTHCAYYLIPSLTPSILIVVPTSAASIRLPVIHIHRRLAECGHTVKTHRSVTDRQIRLSQSAEIRLASAHCQAIGHSADHQQHIHLGLHFQRCIKTDPLPLLCDDCETGPHTADCRY